MTGRRAPVSLAETFGLTPFARRLEEARLMLAGDPHLPPSRFGLSSLKLLMPLEALRTWAGGRRADRRIPLLNLFNRTPTPIEEGWSVRVTQVLDFRGRANTYDSHNGTDFIVPVGTPVAAAAPGRVVRVASEFHRGGLKVFIDHGEGLMTTYNHLARALVVPGSVVGRGDEIALSGASGVDALLAFPWVAPHVHFNVWLGGVNVDPFAAPGETPLWRAGNEPVAHDGPPDRRFAPSVWDEAAVDRTIAACRDRALAEELASVALLERRAADTLFHVNYFPTRFAERPPLYASVQERRSVLDLPFRAADFAGIVHVDESP